MSILLKHVPIVKALLLVGFAVVAPFVSLQNPFTHWAWLVFGSLALMIGLLEILQYRQQNQAPEQRARKYLLDFDGWQERGGIQYYVADQKYTVRVNDTDLSLAYQQEWTRGEIGRHYDHGNAAFSVGIFFGATLLHNVHMVVFDGGKKIAVAPFWQAIGKGRIYYYLADSIEFIYQQFLAHERGTDYSKALRGIDGTGEFDVPVFANEGELDQFLSLCGSEFSDFTSDEEEQNRLFIENLKTYRHFKEGWSA